MPDQQVTGLSRRKRPPQAGSGNGGGAHVYAAIDLGTNNCRMLAARAHPRGAEADGFKVIDSFSRIVRLGEGAQASGRLAEDAMARTVEALKICADKMKGLAVCCSRSVATEACRKADNGEEFLHRVKAATGIRLEAIPPEEEASLTLAGCSPLLRRRHPFALLFDIGGGSTEIMWVKQGEKPGDAPRQLGMMSIPCGVVNFAERFGGDPVSTGTYREMVACVSDQLEPFDRQHDISRYVKAGQVRLLGTSGTVTTVGAVHLGLNRYHRARVDGLDLSMDDIIRVGDILARMNHDERAAHPCIGHGRADLVVMGCAILEAIRRRWPAARLRIADRGIREGLLLSLIAAGGQGCKPQGRQPDAGAPT